MPEPVIALLLVLASLLLVLAAFWPSRPRPASPAIRPIALPAPAARSPALTPSRAGLLHLLARHPDPLLAVFQTAFWLTMPLVLANHLMDRQRGIVAHFVWILSIVPHEAGHFVCAPFGWVLHVLGGSIWQVLVYMLLALYAGAIRHRIGLALIFWTIAGHSLINLGVYVGDAAERDLPLIFGMDKSAHDWGNLLTHYDLLAYDDMLALSVTLAGAALVLIAALLGIVTAWWMPRAWRLRDPAAAEGLREAQRLEVDLTLRK